MAQSLIAVEPGELSALIAEAVQQATKETKAPNPRALTVQQLQDTYAISVGTVKRLRKLGLPHYFIGDSPRFSLDEVHRWILEHGGEL